MRCGVIDKGIAPADGAHMHCLGARQGCHSQAKNPDCRDHLSRRAVRTRYARTWCPDNW